MVHRDILKIFEQLFPDYSGIRIKQWFPNGKNSIRIRHNNRSEYVFTYNGPDDWIFETVSSFWKKMGGNKNGRNA